MVLRISVSNHRNYVGGNGSVGDNWRMNMKITQPTQVMNIQKDMGCLLCDAFKKMVNFFYFFFQNMRHSMAYICTKMHWQLQARF